MSNFWRKLRGWLRRDAISAELEEEMRTHLEMKAEASASPDAVRRQFGNTPALLEASRDAWGWPAAEAWLRDFAFGVRIMLRRPGFAATIVLTLALGIGSTAAIFSLIDTVLVRPLDYPEADRLVWIREKQPGIGLRKLVAPARLDDWRQASTAFTAIGAVSVDTYIVSDGVTPERVDGARVMADFFAAMATRPQLGRVLGDADTRFGSSPRVVISNGYWQRRFGGDPDVIGRTLRISDRPHEIVGVMPPSFQFPAGNDLWVPAQFPPELMRVREARFLTTVARLKDGVSIERAAADLGAVANMLAGQYPLTDRGWSVEIAPLKDRVVGEVRSPFALLFGSAALLLLITCGNVACLLLGRLNSRAAEIATRRALGASRGALARQLLAEGMTFAAAGGLLGAALLALAMSALRQLPRLPRANELEADGRAMAVIAAVTLGTAILSALAPVLQTYRRDAASLRGMRVVGGQRLTRWLVAAQFALTTVLLTAAGIFHQSLLRLEQIPLGFDADRILALRVSARFAESPAATVQRHQRLLDELSTVPGVAAVAMSAGLPGVDAAWPSELMIEGESDDGVKRYVTTRVVTAGFFESLGIRHAGETCRMNTGDPPFEALINRRLAERYFPDRNPIGRTISEGQLRRPMRIVGIANDVRDGGLASDPEPLIYICGYARFWPDSDIIVRTAGDPASLAGPVRDAARSVDRSRVVYSLRPLTSAIDATLAPNRFRALVIGLFSALALLLAAIGLYGVTAYMVASRTREIGVRMALGARQGQILAEVLRSGGRLAIAGVLAGLAIAAPLSTVAASRFAGVQPFDWMPYAQAASVLAAAALLACLAPGRRAVRIDPAVALRDS